MTVPERALRREATRELEYGSILVPLFGTPLDDDIIQTAGRLAGDEHDDFDSEEGATIEALWVFEVPMALPIDARLPEAQLQRARAALRRAKAVGEEYEGVEVATATVRARRAGQAIVDEARRRGVEAIVLAAEQPSRIRGGALLGGRGGPDGQLRGGGDEVRGHQGAVPGDPHGATGPRTSPCATVDRACQGRADRLESAQVFVLIVGAGRVGSSVARSALAAGHEVSVLDEDPLSHERLDAGMETSWEDAGGLFTVGHAIEADALEEAGIERADIFIASTDGDNTNLDDRPDRQARLRRGSRRGADHGPVSRRLVRGAGPRDDLPDEDRDRAVRHRGGRLMYAIVAGGGKVGWNLARELMAKGHEVTLIESNRNRYLTVEQELEHVAQYGDATELWVLERAGIQRAELVIAVTGDDEDNILICQIAREKYLCDRIIARVNNPRNRRWFELLDIQPAVSATDLILRLIEHEVPSYGLVHLLDLRDEKLEIIEVEVTDGAPAAGKPVSASTSPTAP